MDVRNSTSSITIGTRCFTMSLLRSLYPLCSPPHFGLSPLLNGRTSEATRTSTTCSSSPTTPCHPSSTSPAFPPDYRTNTQSLSITSNRDSIAHIREKGVVFIQGTLQTVSIRTVPRAQTSGHPTPTTLRRGELHDRRVSRVPPASGSWFHTACYIRRIRHSSRWMLMGSCAGPPSLREHETSDGNYHLQLTSSLRL